MKRGDMTDGIFLMHIVDALRETVELSMRGQSPNKVRNEARL